MEEVKRIDNLRESVIRLGQQAGLSTKEALGLVDELEQEFNQLNAELKRLKLDLTRRISAAQGMNSRLKDALRE